MMKNIRLIVLLVLPFIVITSCENSFLDLHSKEATDARTAIKDVESLEYAVYGVYALLQNGSYYNRSFPFVADLVSDNVYLSSRTRSYYKTIGKFTASANQSRVERLWEQIFRVVVNSNFIIQKGPKLNNVSDSDTLRQHAMVGEAYALRALANFDLVRLFAQPYNYTNDASHLGIPLVLESTINTDEISYPGRSSVKEVYDAIVNDFREAIKRLPTKVPGRSASFKGRITLNAAKALLSRVYLYMGEWEKSIEMASDVIDSKQYSLLPTNELVDKYSNSNNSESIFEIINTFTDNSGSSSLAYYYNQKGYGDGLPTWDLYNIYSPDDVRRNFMKIGDRSGGGGEKNVPIVTKYRKLEGNFAQDIIVIRLAEVYLNRAEAEAHLGMKSNDQSEYNAAITDLKKIAERGDPTVNINSSLKGQALIDRILLERRKELAFEGQRLFDLTRNKNSFEKYYSGGDSVLVEYPDNKTILPIPENERDINPNLEQNPGY